MMSKSEPRYVSRELSWLEFNQRVLDEAREDEQPLLERLKFLAITATNLDEFFMVRVGGLRMLTEDGVERRDPAGLTPARQLEAISDRTQRMTADQYACYLQDLQPALEAEGIRRLHAHDLNERQQRFVSRCSWATR
jgi:polyphosphate kinase